MGKLLWGIVVFFGLDIKNVESMFGRNRSNPEKNKRFSGCLNPKTSPNWYRGMICSGDSHGYCEKLPRKRCKECSPYYCGCYSAYDEFIDRIDNEYNDGELWLYNSRYFGKWCQCSPVDCIAPWKDDFGKVEYF